MATAPIQSYIISNVESPDSTETARDRERRQRQSTGKERMEQTEKGSEREMGNEDDESNGREREKGKREGKGRREKRMEREEVSWAPSARLRRTTTEVNRDEL